MWAFSALPLIQAPMAGVQDDELCIAVCEAGGLGSIPAAMLTPATLAEQISRVRARTSAPFNVNFFVHREPNVDPQTLTRWRARLAGYYEEFGLATDAAAGATRAPFDKSLCEVVETLKPPLVSFHFGLPEPDLLARVKASGAKVLASATTVAEARWLEARGVDVVIAQGREAGGHRGLFLTDDLDAQPGLMALLPQVVDAVRVPVVAAGGVGDGRGVAASLALGAAAVQIGTAYLRTPQAKTSALHRAALESARDDATRLTNVFTGRPARGLLNRFMREMGVLNADAPSFPLAAAAVGPLRAAAEKAGQADFSPLWAGESAALARAEDAGDATRRFWREAQGVLAGGASRWRD